MVHPSLPAGFDFTDPEIYAERLPVEELKELRKTAPIWWQEQPDGVGGFNDGGYWVVTKHKDVKEVSLRSDVFSSWENTAIPRFQDDITREAIELQRYVMLNMDAPHHTRLRKIIPAASPRVPLVVCATSSTSVRRRSPRLPRRVAPATSSSRCRVSCRCKPLLVCLVCRSRTAASSLTGPTK